MSEQIVAHPSARAAWKHHWFRCCGDCDGSDCSACCLAWQVPSIAFGENSRRALRKSFWKEVIIYFTLTTLAVLIWVAVLDIKCPLKENDDGDLTRDGCNPRYYWIPALVVLPLAILGVIYAGLRRAAIREAFGIPGSKLGDICLWFWCSPCALSQETRTLWHNEVKDGMWRGPNGAQAVAFKSVPVHQAPVGAQMPQSYGAQYGGYGQYNV